jgi:UDP-N-acetylmuramoyl-L-alanyl-D-glutamate--2,6-diaminopimelate ligase
MLLSILLSTLTEATLVGPREAEIGGIAYDARVLERGELFVALPGVHVDGHRFIAAAVARGAAAVLCQYEPGDDPPVPHVLVPDTRAAMADLAAAFYGHPSDHLTVIGVTGTDGKTTTGFLLHAMLQGAGHAAGLIGTVAFRVGDREWENSSRQTTPEAPDVQRLLAAMAAARVEYAVVEATSHALMLDRLRGCHFDAGILTNITSDHLDFHGTLDQYRAAKARLFHGLGSGKKAAAPVAILNRDDASYEYMRAASAAPVLSYGRHPEAAVRAHEVDVLAGGIRFRATTPAGDVEVRSPLTGRFNVHNLLAALAFAVSQGIDPGAAAAALAAMPGVAGRMRRVDAGQPFTVVVDYAHTPDSLAKVLDELRAVTAGRLIAVFGAAGERDRGKRPHMGRIAAERCELVILTDEDPRLEDRLAIIEEIAAGAGAAGARAGESLLLCPERRAAIEVAVRAAQPGDTILLAGKGHERCIIVGTERIPWDEEAEARAALAAALGAAT